MYIHDCGIHLWTGSVSTSRIRSSLDGMLIGMPIHYHRSIAVSKNIEKSKPSKLVVSYVSIFYWTSYLQVDR